MLGIFGLALTLLFFVLQAPDVALSEIVVGSVGLPVIILPPCARSHSSLAREREEEDGE